MLQEQLLINELRSFKIKDNRSVEENELIKLRKELKNLNGKRYFKASSTNNMQKVEIIANNKSKYKIRTMCRFLKISK